MFTNKTKPTLVILDLSVFLHRLSDGLNAFGPDVLKKHYQGIVKAQLATVLSNQYLDGLIDVKNSTCVLAVDQKMQGLKYWRHDYLMTPEVVVNLPQKTKTDQARQNELAELMGTREYLKREPETYNRVQQLTAKLGINYKAGRKHPEPLFQRTKRTVYKVLDEVSGFSVVRRWGYEADDVAAGIVKVNRDLGSPVNIVLSTVDSDWMGLIGPDVAWFCQHGYNPRVRYTAEQINEWAKRRLKTTLERPSDIWKVKQKSGDKSDNLPAGCPIEVVDLLNPPEGFGLFKQQDFRAEAALLFKLADQGNNWLANYQGAAKYLREVGSEQVIRPYNPYKDWYSELAA